jgi:hypothetical protein
MSLANGLRLGLFAFVVGGAALGCQTAHYVARYPDRGIVAIPHDTPELRAKAEKLMHDQFPAGYVIDDVRAVPLGRAYETITRVGPYAEVELHQRHEVMLYYHGQQAGVAQAPHTGEVAAYPGTPGSGLQQTSAASVQAGAPSGLPAQPVPVSR